MTRYYTSRDRTRWATVDDDSTEPPGDLLEVTEEQFQAIQTNQETAIVERINARGAEIRAERSQKADKVFKDSRGKLGDEVAMILARNIDPLYDREGVA